jgi:hypothetical protein
VADLEELVRLRPEMVQIVTPDRSARTALHVAAAHANELSVAWLLAKDGAHRCEARDGCEARGWVLACPAVRGGG